MIFTQQDLPQPASILCIIQMFRSQTLHKSWKETVYTKVQSFAHTETFIHVVQVQTEKSEKKLRSQETHCEDGPRKATTHNMRVCTRNMNKMSFTLTFLILKTWCVYRSQVVWTGGRTFSDTDPFDLTMMAATRLLSSNVKKNPNPLLLPSNVSQLTAFSGPSALARTGAQSFMVWQQADKCMSNH